MEKKPNKWSVWLEDDLIGPGESPYPAANGIKVRGGFAYITVSARFLIVRVPIRSDGSAGAVETVWRDIIGDDFAFDESGSLYVTTHPHIHSFASNQPANAQRSRASIRAWWAPQRARSGEHRAMKMRFTYQPMGVSPCRTSVESRAPS